MARSKELTPTLRAKLCELRDIGWTYKSINLRYPDIALSTIQYTVRKERQRSEQQSLHRSGRPKAISLEEQQRLLDLISENEHITMRELSQSLPSRPSIRTVQRLLRSLSMRKRNEASGFLVEDRPLGSEQRSSVQEDQDNRNYTE